MSRVERDRRFQLASIGRVNSDFGFKLAAYTETLAPSHRLMQGAHDVPLHLVLVHRLVDEDVDSAADPTLFVFEVEPAQGRNLNELLPEEGGEEGPWLISDFRDGLLQECGATRINDLDHVLLQRLPHSIDSVVRDFTLDAKRPEAFSRRSDDQATGVSADNVSSRKLADVFLLESRRIELFVETARFGLVLLLGGELVIGLTDRQSEPGHRNDQDQRNLRVHELLSKVAHRSHCLGRSSTPILCFS